MKQAKWYLSIIGMLLIVLSGCAKKGPILLSVAYEPPEDKVAVAKKITVGVSPLKENRDKKSSVVGVAKGSGEVVNDLVIQGTAAGLATDSLKDALSARGMTVKDSADWDLTAAGIKAEGVDVVIGGEVQKLWVESTSEAFRTYMKAAVTVKFVVADVTEKKIVQTLTLRSSNSDESMLFSETAVGDTLSGALSSAIDQLLLDEKEKKEPGVMCRNDRDPVLNDVVAL